MNKAQGLILGFAIADVNLKQDWPNSKKALGGRSRRVV